MRSNLAGEARGVPLGDFAPDADDVARDPIPVVVGLHGATARVAHAPAQLDVVQQPAHRGEPGPGVSGIQQAGPQG